MITQEELDAMSEEEEAEYWYCWEEQDWMENKLFYKYDLEHLEELPSKEKPFAS